MSIIDNLQVGISGASLAIANDVVLFRFGSRESKRPTAAQKQKGMNSGGTYLKGTFVGENLQGELVCTRVLNVFCSSTADHSVFTGDGESEEGVFGSVMVFLSGVMSQTELTVAESGTARIAIALNNAMVCRYDKSGNFSYTEGAETLVLVGEPGAPVTVSFGAGKFAHAPALTEERKVGKKVISFLPTATNETEEDDDAFDAATTLDDILNDTASAAVAPKEGQPVVRKVAAA